jgi:hypothetical protein
MIMLHRSRNGPIIAFSDEPLPIPDSTISPINCITIAQNSSTQNSTVNQGCYTTTNYTNAVLSSLDIHVADIQLLLLTKRATIMPVTYTGVPNDNATQKQALSMHSL